MSPFLTRALNLHGGETRDRQSSLFTEFVTVLFGSHRWNEILVAVNFDDQFLAGQMHEVDLSNRTLAGLMILLAERAQEIQGSMITSIDTLRANQGLIETQFRDLARRAQTGDHGGDEENEEEGEEGEEEETPVPVMHFYMPGEVHNGGGGGYTQ